MSKTIQQIEEWLKEKPHLSYEIEEHLIAVKATSETGFNVVLTDEGDEFIVFYDGWHEHFGHSKDAIDCFQFGFSSRCRIKVVCRGKFEHKWTLQYLEGEQWTDYSTTALLFFPFWRKKEVKYFQNGV